MTHEEVGHRVARWVADAPFVVSAVLAFLQRFVPAVARDAERSLGIGGRLRISIDLEAGAVTRFRVRLLRSDADAYCNETLYTWEPPKGD